VAQPREASPWSAVAALGAVFGVLGVVTLAGRSSRAAPRPRRVALIGDSYAVGLGPELAKLLPDFKYEGHVGVSAAQWLAQGADDPSAAYANWLPGYRPTLALVSLGANGGPNQNSADFHAIVRAIHGIGATVVWIEPPAGVAGLDAVRAILAPASLGVGVIAGTRTPIGPDNLHPISYGPWAAEIAKAVHA